MTEREPNVWITSALIGGFITTLAYTLAMAIGR